MVSLQVCWKIPEDRFKVASPRPTGSTKGMRKLLGRSPVVYVHREEGVVTENH